MAESQEEFNELLASQRKRLQRSESAEWRAFQKRIERGREAAARGEPIEFPKLPSISDTFKEKVTADLAERARLEAARIAALTPEQIRRSTLPWQERQRIQTWEAVNPGLSYPN